MARPIRPEDFARHARRTPPADMPMVRCGHERCLRLMPAARVAIGLPECERCTRDARLAAPARPQYETEVWSQGGRL